MEALRSSKLVLAAIALMALVTVGLTQLTYEDEAKIFKGWTGVEINTVYLSSEEVRGTTVMKRDSVEKYNPMKNEWDRVDIDHCLISYNVVDMKLDCDEPIDIYIVYAGVSSLAYMLRAGWLVILFAITLWYRHEDS